MLSREEFRIKEGRIEFRGKTFRRYGIFTGLISGKRLNRFKEGLGEFVNDYFIIRADLGMFCEIFYF